MKLEIVPIKFKEAKEFVRRHHRHCKPPVGHIFSIAVAIDDEIVGVAIVGRPISRRLDNGLTAEVTRLCTDGTKNACSKLYAGAWRAARELGYKRIITYILKTEPGTTLQAAGWKCLGECGGGSWNVRTRPRVNMDVQQKKFKFERSVDKAGSQ